MSQFKSIRRSLAKARDELLYGRRDRRLRDAAMRMRGEWVDVAARRLPALAPANPAPVLELHTMCGEAQAAMGLWSSWSSLRFFPGARLVVHSDGTLTPTTIAAWQALAPGMRLVTTEESRGAMERRFAAFPRLRDWSQRYHFGLKLGGTYSVAEAATVLEIDTDTLTLSDPGALAALLSDPAARLAWNQDLRPCYAYPEALLKEVLGPLMRTLPARLNGGYMMARLPEDSHWSILEEALDRLWHDPRTDPLRYWMHQTLWAILASRLGAGAGPLPREYDVHDGPTRPNAAMRHYVGNPGIRPRFFTEGVPALLRDAAQRGQVPPGFRGQGE